MIFILFGLGIFFAIHFIPSVPPLRTTLVARLGESGYLAAFSLISLFSLSVVVWGWGQAEYVEIYEPWEYSRYLALGMMLPVFIVLASMFTKGRIHKFLVHPMLSSVAGWAICHLLANGDLTSILMFAAVLVFSLYEIISLNMRGDVSAFNIVPKHDLISVVIGMAFYGLWIYLHPVLIGMPVLY